MLILSHFAKSPTFILQNQFLSSIILDFKFYFEMNYGYKNNISFLKVYGNNSCKKTN